MKLLVAAIRARCSLGMFSRSARLDNANAILDAFTPRRFAKGGQLVGSTSKEARVSRPLRCDLSLTVGWSPRTLYAFLRLAAHHIKIAGPPPQVPPGILQIPECNDDGVVDRHRVGTLPRIIVVNDKGRRAIQQMLYENAAGSNPNDTSRLSRASQSADDAGQIGRAPHNVRKTRLTQNYSRTQNVLQSANLMLGTSRSIGRADVGFHRCRGLTCRATLFFAVALRA